MKIAPVVIQHITRSIWYSLKLPGEIIVPYVMKKLMRYYVRVTQNMMIWAAFIAIQSLSLIHI